MQLNVKRCVLLSIALPCLAVASSGASGQSAPSWTVGDSWKVGTWHGQVFRRPTHPSAPASQAPYNPRGRMITVTFEVKGIQKVNKADCYEVQVTFPKEDTGFRRRYQVYYSTQSCRLIRVRDVSIKPDGTTKDVVTECSGGLQGPVLPANVHSLVPLDWPDFMRPNATSSAGTARTASQTTTLGAASPTGGAAVQQYEITLMGAPGSKQAKIVQLWQPGDPWWRQAKTYRGTQLVSESVLLEVNGRTIASSS